MKKSLITIAVLCAVSGSVLVKAADVETIYTSKIHNNSLWEEHEVLTSDALKREGNIYHRF